MSLRPALLAQLLSFDDEAFVALANRGLLRRAYKDLESSPPRLLEEGAEHLLLECGPYQLRFDQRGPAFAQCSCPASGVCQHILAGALGLREMLAEQGPPLAPGAEPEPAPDQRQVLLDSLLALPHAELLKHGGKPGYRWAWQFVMDLDLEQELHLGGEHNLTLTLGTPPLTLRYMGGPLGGMLADQRSGALEKHQVAAVLALRRLQGLELIAPEPLGGANAESTPALREAARSRLRQGARQLLEESVAVGLAHLSQAMQQRYVTLAVWAQGADYPRLALSLRRLADQVQLLLERAAGADGQRLFDELSRCYALLQALASAAQRGEEPVRLLGQARSQYTPSTALELWGLGANAWRSASGYQGLSLVFWSPAQQGFLSCTEARPELQRGFNPLLRYRHPGPWSGLLSPAHASGRRLSLMGAQVNGDGRLSVAESVQATVLEPLTAAQWQQLPAAADWSVLLQARSAQRRSLLTPARPMNDWALLQPAAVGAVQFDSTRQTLVWPLYDHQGATLWVELRYGAFTRHAIGRIEQVAGEPWVEGSRLVARVYEHAGRLIAEPLSLIRAAAAPGQPVLDALHFDQAPATATPPAAVDETLDAPLQEVPLPSCHLLPEFAGWLCQQAERGVDPHVASGVDQALQQRGLSLRAAGYSAFERMAPEAGVPARLIIAHYLCLQYQHLQAAGGDIPTR